ncbi:hypothetical protein KXD93_04705 [Mucilaginibacter sp. BJC16-A38]|uniref:hypothetical protein n=1 Tax=Mucilaginibacter phenanthrenivorans TaxID=1234842 RepID=UPI0021571075|nr:hypothetical protein [Mucilaginibacter phenanthrenivorans]MCR8556926.1 hypothetical protein [Mucilaginibacter phenanthrenivorans]
MKQDLEDVLMPAVNRQKNEQREGSVSVLVSRPISSMDRLLFIFKPYPKAIERREGLVAVLVSRLTSSRNRLPFYHKSAG